MVLKKVYLQIKWTLWIYRFKYRINEKINALPALFVSENKNVIVTQHPPWADTVLRNKIKIKSNYILK